MRHKIFKYLFLPFFLVPALTGFAQYTVLHNFNWANTNGFEPTGSITISGNLLYGATSGGGAYLAGTVFSMQTDGSNFSILHSFGAGSDGYSPDGSLTLSGNMLYGVTWSGGLYHVGNIFSVQTDGGNYTIMHSFNDTDGTSPYLNSLLLFGNTLYGMTPLGGLYGPYGFGVIFSINTNGSNYTVLHNFGIDGSYPCGSLILSGDTLYGMTYGGGVNDYGVIFSVQTNGSNYSPLHSFDSIHGGHPYGSLVISGSTLYGMTYMGGTSNDGVIFSVQNNGANYTVLHSFNGFDGANPHGSLTLTGGMLYGMTSKGGNGDSGVIFRVKTDGSNYEVLYNFEVDDNGLLPYGDVAFSNNVLYGMTHRGGTNVLYGVIFKDSIFDAGVQEINNNASNEVKVYPNPSSGIFTIQVSPSPLREGTMTAEVYNMLGEKVYSNNFTGTQIQFDLTGRPNGLYIYKVVNSDGNSAEGKLINQH